MALSDALEKAEAIVNGLVTYRDSLITTDSLKREEELEQKLKTVLVELDQLQLSIENKAVFFYLRGKALNSVSSKYDSRAVECLSKSVKLDPSHIQAWNELGECYWKNKDVESAANCFKSALSKGENKVSLRNLSMVQRQQGDDFNFKVENIKMSVETAKKAVKMDLHDGHSWFILGNAYLSVFFYAGQSPAILKKCMAAYSKAEEDENELKNPDLYYNRAVAYKFQEDFNAALDGFKNAFKIDPSWNQVKEEENDLMKRLKESHEMIQCQGNLKAKKINSLKSQLKDSDYGPYASGSYVSLMNKSISLSKVSIEELLVGWNKNSVVCGKVVAVIQVKDAVPFPFILMDGTGKCIAVSVFNLAMGKGMIIGDSVAIAEPFVEFVDVDVAEKKVQYHSIRVDNPVIMVVNKRKVGAERLAFSVLTVTNKSD